MAWLRNGNPQPDTGFTSGDVNYPAGWIKNAPQSEREKLNIVAEPPRPFYDQRFSYGFKSDGTENWKDLTQLKKYWSDKQTEMANLTLSQSDWRIIKAKETGGTVPTDWKTYRAAVRTACNNRQTFIESAKTAAELKAFIAGEATITQNKKDSDGKDIEHTDPLGNSYDPKQYEQEIIGNPAKLNGKYPWPDAPAS